VLAPVVDLGPDTPLVTELSPSVWCPAGGPALFLECDGAWRDGMGGAAALLHGRGDGATDRPIAAAAARFPAPSAAAAEVRAAAEGLALLAAQPPGSCRACVLASDSPVVAQFGAGRPLRDPAMHASLSDALALAHAAGFSVEWARAPRATVALADALARAARAGETPPFPLPAGTRVFGLSWAPCG